MSNIKWYPAAVTLLVIGCGGSTDNGNYAPGSGTGGTTPIDSGTPSNTGGSPVYFYGIRPTGGDAGTGGSSTTPTGGTSSVDSGTPTSTGGSQGTLYGIRVTGGASSLGGHSSTGGATATGGRSATGGASATGGVSATGGTTHIDSGTPINVGGRTAQAYGTLPVTGGRSAMGGASATGGSAATAGSSTRVNTGGNGMGGYIAMYGPRFDKHAVNPTSGGRGAFCIGSDAEGGTPTGTPEDCESS